MNRYCLPVLFCFLFVFEHIYSQGYCSGDTVIFTEAAHPVDFDDIVYKTAPQVDEWNFDVPENIPLRVYYPTDLQPGEKRPLIALVHGGYFIWGSYLDFDAFAKSLAQKGFITATIEYRLCHRGDCEVARLASNPCNLNWSNSFLASAYVAAVDVNDGIRWLQQHAADYHIDPEEVVVAGHSAGAFTALNVAFLDQNEIQQLIPSAGVSGKYLGEPLDPVSGIRACIDMSGASLNPDWIEKTEVIDQNIAVGIVHGTSDGVVDYDAGHAVPCCQTYGTTVYGGCEVAKRVRDLGGNWYLLSGEGFGHDIGEQPWFGALSVQMPAFVIKTVVCGQNIAKHSVIQRSTPLAVCPGNSPNLQQAALCDVDAITPVITTPVIETSAGRVEKALELLVYPNPVDDVLHVNSLSNGANGIWHVSVFSMDGRLIRQMTLELDGSGTISTGDVPPGVYCLFFQAGKDGRSGVVRLKRN